MEPAGRFAGEVAGRPSAPGAGGRRPLGEPPRLALLRRPARRRGKGKERLAWAPWIICCGGETSLCREGAALGVMGVGRAVQASQIPGLAFERTSVSILKYPTSYTSTRLLLAISERSLSLICFYAAESVNFLLVSPAPCCLKDSVAAVTRLAAGRLLSCLQSA